MKDFTKYYINLSNCSEGQQEHIFSLLPKPRTQYLLEMDDDCYFLCYKYNAPYGFEWIVCVDSFTNGKTKLLYPEFIKLFEGGEGEKESIYDVDFGGNVMARIKIVGNKIEVTNAMNGYGNSIPLSEITITNSNQ